VEEKKQRKPALFLPEIAATLPLERTTRETKKEIPRSSRGEKEGEVSGARKRGGRSLPRRKRRGGGKVYFSGQRKGGSALEGKPCAEKGSPR